MTKIFVYGTLKKGFPRHALVLGDSEFLGEAQVGSLALIKLMRFPAVIRTEKESDITYGEVYEVSDNVLDTIRKIESAPKLFEEQDVTALIGTEKVQAKTFVLVGNATGVEVAGGIWEKRHAIA